MEKSLFPDLLAVLHSRGLFTWDKLILSWSSSLPIWKDADSLGLPHALRQSWELATKHFIDIGIKKTGSYDELIWSKQNSSLTLRVKDLYEAASSSLQVQPSPIFPFKFWKVSCPLKAILFSWLVFFNRNLTWEVLQRKGWSGPSRCVMCGLASESNDHIFFQCPASALIWHDLSTAHGFPPQVFPSVQEAFRWWGALPSMAILIYFHLLVPLEMEECLYFSGFQGPYKLHCDAYFSYAGARFSIMALFLTFCFFPLSASFLNYADPFYCLSFSSLDVFLFCIDFGSTLMILS